MNLVSYVKNNRAALIKEPFVIVLGSGVHAQAYSAEKNVLNDWDELLKSIDSKFQPSGNYPLDFESILSRKCLNKPSLQRNEIEEIQLNKIAEVLKKFCLKPGQPEYPVSFLSSPLISDVVNLNFDLVIENLPGGHIPKGKLIKRSPADSYSTLNYELEGLTFWHPHGSIDVPKSILLSQRRYFLYSQKVEQLRKRFMAKVNSNKPNRIIPENWFELLATRPIIICGASLSPAEWDIWLAIVSRYRMRSNTKQKNQPIFKMYGCEQRPKSARGHINHFYPISSQHRCFSDEWILINKLFN